MGKTDDDINPAESNEPLIAEAPPESDDTSKRGYYIVFGFIFVAILAIVAIFLGVLLPRRCPSGCYNNWDKLTRCMNKEAGGGDPQTFEMCIGTYDLQNSFIIPANSKVTFSCEGKAKTESACIFKTYSDPENDFFDFYVSKNGQYIGGEAEVTFQDVKFADSAVRVRFSNEGSTYFSGCSFENMTQGIEIDSRSTFFENSWITDNPLGQAAVEFGRSGIIKLSPLSFSFKNCTFENNHDTIVDFSDFSILSNYFLEGGTLFEDCLFKGNTGDSSDLIDIFYTYDKALPEEAQFLIKDCHFEDNHGGIDIYGSDKSSLSLELIGCTFKRNQGQIINIRSGKETVKLQDVVFVSNQYNSRFIKNMINIRGAAIDLQNLFVEKNNYIRDSKAGDLLVISDSSVSNVTATLKNCTFIENDNFSSIVSTDFGNSLFGHFKVINCNFTDNSVRQNVIQHEYETSHSIFNGCSFQGNRRSASDKNDGLENGLVNLRSNNYMEFSNCLFKDNIHFSSCVFCPFGVEDTYISKTCFVGNNMTDYPPVMLPYVEESSIENVNNYAKNNNIAGSEYGDCMGILFGAEYSDGKYVNGTCEEFTASSCAYSPDDKDLQVLDQM